jgi:hypothetical protein
VTPCFGGKMRYWAGEFYVRRRSPAQEHTEEAQTIECTWRAAPSKSTEQHED